MIGRTATCVLLAAMLLLGLVSGVRAQSFDDGLAAFRSGKIQAAHDIWLPLAEAGDVSSQYSLGKLYEKGDAPIAEDAITAVAWYRKAAEQGLPQAQNDLAMMYAQGRAGPIDLEHAVGLWRKAAEQDYPWAQFNLGIALFRGHGVMPDQQKAVVWFRRAADSGLPESQFILGQLTQHGLVLEQSQSQALYWYQLAGQQGHRKGAEQAEALAQAGVEAEAPLQASEADQQSAALDPAPEPEAAETEASKSTAPEPEVSESAELDAVPVRKPDPGPEPAPEPGLAPEPTPEPAAVAAAPEAPVTADADEVVVETGPGFHLWLASAQSETEAVAIWQAAKTRHPATLAQQAAQFPQQAFDGEASFYRVMVGPLPSLQAAEQTCATLRNEDPGIFCQVRSN